MAGPNEQRLHRAFSSASPADIEQARRSWVAAADGLSEVSSALAGARQRVAAAWTGTGADSATAAFADLGELVDGHRDHMLRAADSLSTAGAALDDARKAYGALPAVPAEPAVPDPGADGEVAVADEVRYLRLQGQRNAALNARESQAGAAYTRFNEQIRVADASMAVAAPSLERHLDSPTAPSSPTAGGRGGSGAGAAGGYRAPGTTRTHIGPYSTADTGTHVGVAGHAGDGVTVSGTHGLSHPDGAVGGVLPGAAAGHVSAGPVLGAGRGSLAADAVGGAAAAAGVVAGLGGALGLAAGARGVGALGGALAGPGVLGARAPLGAAQGVLGGARGAGGTVTGGLRGATAGRSSAGLRGGLALNEGEAVPGGRAGVAGSRGPVLGGTSAVTSGAGGSEASGSPARAGGRGGAAATVADAQGRAAGGSRGTAGGRGRGGMHGMTGRRDEDRDDERGHLVFEDDAWLDDEAGPGVIR